jgi:hypothetical protein
LLQLTDTVKVEVKTVANSYVLKALRILGLEEMLKLSQSALVKPVVLKKAAGEDLVFWSDAPDEEVTPNSIPETPGKVLPFKKNYRPPVEEVPQNKKAKSEASEEEPKHIVTTEFVLLNREMAKESAVSAKKDAVKGYARATEMYVVKTSNIEGSESIRFASTNGVLVNKKQA